MNRHASLVVVPSHGPAPIRLLFGRLLLSVAFVCLLTGAQAIFSVPAFAQPAFVAFESGPVRPLTLSPDGSRLFAVDTPDNHLEIFDVTSAGLVFAGSVPVGLEPVAVAARTNDEVWVVNHLSDSVSIVDLAASPPQVVKTLLVGDEPRDIVFAGSGGGRAFISTAHRGQHRTHATISPAVPGSGDPALQTEGVSRADVWVFDAQAPGAAVGGQPIEILSFFSDTPRALATSADGSTVYVAAFHSGNQTTAILESSVCDGFDAAAPCAVGSVVAPGGVPGPDDNADGDPAPETGVIVKLDQASGEWRDALGRDWSALVRFDLPDHDVFAFDANTLAPGTVFDHVGTILFNMVVNPATGKLYVTNTESPNHVRFEGPGLHGGSTVQGHLSETRISVLDPVAGAVDPQHLNPHIDYANLHTDVPDLVDTTARTHSLATPLQPVVSGDGSTVYMAAFGSARIGVFDAAALEDPSFESSFDPTAASADYIDTAGGPAGLVLDEVNDRLYVWTRFDNSVASIDLTTRITLQTLPLHNPEPDSIVEGRPFLYDAVATSGNGEASCASCHIFGDFDSLVWNLGNPDDGVTTNPQPVFPGALAGPSQDFHPMKGPMTTQTLRGLATHGGMHWRGDRTNGFFGIDPCTDPVGTPCNEDLSFRNFIVAFEGLVGHDGLIDEDDMQKFADFILQVFLPPNPVRALDNALTPNQQAGAAKYVFPATDGNQVSCDDCHRLDPLQGMFGGNGDQAFEGLPQTAKVPHLRNAYQKIGMFGISAAGGVFLGPQVRGTGFLHDGAVDTIFNFLSAPNFVLTPLERFQLEQFILAFDSDLAPIVGQQVTLGPSPHASTTARVDLILQRAQQPFDSLMLGGAVRECDVIVKGSVGGEPRGWLLETASGRFLDDVGGSISEGALRDLATTEGPLTFTAVPPGSGTRMGINRDGDLHLDGLDNCPNVANDDQTDTDEDGIGDACELVPEPGLTLMLGVGVLALAGLHRSRPGRYRSRSWKVSATR